MAGAMSEQGKSLNEMAGFLREAVKEIGIMFSFDIFFSLISVSKNSESFCSVIPRKMR